MKDRFLQYLNILEDKGLMKEYSDEHLIINAMNGKFKYFDNFLYKIDPCYRGTEKDLAMTFLVNFSTKLERLSKIFNEEDIEYFVENQLASGKSNYDELQFFRAMSEMHILLYLGNFCPNISEALYEPKLHKSKKNPEARLVLKDETIIDIEVKTPGFHISNRGNNSTGGIVKPNLILTEKEKKTIEKSCRKKEITYLNPRVKKLKDFIVSASEKFEQIKHEKHYNLLFINWTYSDFPECDLREPLTLLINPFSGIFYNKNSAHAVGVDTVALSKISAIIMYQDNFHSILSSDFRNIFRGKNSYLLINPEIKGQDIKLLESLLYMKIYNSSDDYMYYPCDYQYFDEHSRKKVMQVIEHLKRVTIERRGLYIKDEVALEKRSYK